MNPRRRRHARRRRRREKIREAAITYLRSLRMLELAYPLVVETTFDPKEKRVTARVVMQPGVVRVHAGVDLP